MSLKKTIKENLVGASVIGVIAGVLAAVAAIAFLSEYGAAIYASSKWSLHTIITVQAIGAFVIVAGAVVVIFGVIPIIWVEVVLRNKRKWPNA